MLGKLRIRCINEKNGCKEISLLSNLDSHETKCHDKSICDQRFCLRSVNHNCVKVF